MPLAKEEVIVRLGRIPDRPDYRDYRFGVEIPKYLPFSSSMVKYASPVGDQGNYGSCVFNAITSCMETLMKKHGIAYQDFSRFFAYYNVRLMYLQSGEISSIKEDCGAEIRDAISSVSKLGICLENTWPYISKDFATKPTKVAYAEALYYQILTYHRVEGLAQMKTCIASARAPFILGFNVYESFLDIGSDGLMPMPGRNEELLGGHAVMVVGYDDRKKVLRIRNSWGTDWGYNGDFFMPYAFAENSDEVSDCWRITRGELI